MKFKFLKSLYSPFKPLKLEFYFGKVAIGTPIFFPRKWIKSKEKEGYLTAIPKKIGFDFVDLGWKTKWSETDYRYEWSPLVSFIFFKWQFVIFFVVPETSHYWESWLYWENNTDKNNNWDSRLKQCMEGFPLDWIKFNGDKEIKVNYYNHIIKEKYLKIKK